MPLQGTFRIDKPLTNISQQYKNYEYIASRVLPDVPVAKESDVYYIYNPTFRREMTLRANGAPAGVATFDVSTSTYYLREHALRGILTDRDYNNVDAPPIQLEADTVENLMDKILLEMEYEAMQLLFTSTSFTNSKTLTSATSWRYHTTTSLPCEDVASVTSYILAYAGVKANTMVMGLEVYDALRNNPNLLDRIKYTQRGVMSTDILSSLFDIPNIYVGSAIYGTAKEGLTNTYTAIWPAYSWIGYIDPRPGIKTKSAACNMRLSNQGNTVKVTTWRDEEVSAKNIMVSTFFKGKVISSTAGYEIIDCAI